MCFGQTARPRSDPLDQDCSMSAREHGANLCAAAKRGSIDEASILLGRDDVASFIDFADEEGFTAVLWASNGKLKILQLLLPHDPNLEVVDGEGMTPLMTAASMVSEA